MCSFIRHPLVDVATSPREALVLAATAYFSDRKLADVRMSDIALSAGMCKANVYNYFRDKDQLFLAAHRSLVLDNLHLVGLELRAQPDLTAKIQVIASAIRAAAQHPLKRLPPELCERALSNPDLRDDLQNVQAELHQCMVEQLRPLLVQAGVPMLDTAAPLFISFMVMIYPLGMLFEPGLDHPAALTQVLTHLLCPPTQTTAAAASGAHTVEPRRASLPASARHRNVQVCST